SGLFCLAEAAADGCVVAAEVVGDFVQGVAPVAVGGGDRVAGGGKEDAERRPERLPVGARDLGRPFEVGGLVADELLAAEEDALDVWLRVAVGVLDVGAQPAARLPACVRELSQERVGGQPGGRRFVADRGGVAAAAPGLGPLADSCADRI